MRFKVSDEDRIRSAWNAVRGSVMDTVPPALPARVLLRQTSSVSSVSILARGAPDPDPELGQVLEFEEEPVDLPLGPSTRVYCRGLVVEGPDDEEVTRIWRRHDKKQAERRAAAGEGPE